ncbi:hypothetical protein MTR_1g045663 [Medicago truncatula]|uniref:K Homology domain-containing protein n=1 Tax=Medicago truncatula TaxID=3880 RepID=A0A072VSR0_MEDTR|nr:hypothetical protein MTR_1g045663 [Medicago truncatula]
MMPLHSLPYFSLSLLSLPYLSCSKHSVNIPVTYHSRIIEYVGSGGKSIKDNLEGIEYQLICTYNPIQHTIISTFADVNIIAAAATNSNKNAADIAS